MLCDYDPRLGRFGVGCYYVVTQWLVCCGLLYWLGYCYGRLVAGCCVFWVCLDVVE